MAVLILVLFALGWYMVDLPKGSTDRTFYFSMHKSVGLTVAALALVRIAWRAGKPGFPPAGGSAPWQHRLAVVTHRLLYLLMVCQPLSGYLSSSFSGFATRFWGVPLPQWADRDPMLNDLFTGVHALLAKILFVLAVLHVCGALSHLVGAHENVLRRMLPEGDTRRG
jgi:cytochrome b561